MHIWRECLSALTLEGTGELEPGQVFPKRQHDCFYVLNKVCLSAQVSGVNDTQFRLFSGHGQFTVSPAAPLQMGREAMLPPGYSLFYLFADLGVNQVKKKPNLNGVQMIILFQNLSNEGLQQYSVLNSQLSQR